MTRQRPKALKAYGVLPGADSVVELGDLGAWRPKLVATDLDGTLLDSAGEVTPRTRAALEACWDAGIPVVGVTGRGPRLLDSVRRRSTGAASPSSRRAGSSSTWNATRCCAPSGCPATRRPR